MSITTIKVGGVQLAIETASELEALNQVLAKLPVVREDYDDVRKRYVKVIDPDSRMQLEFRSSIEAEVLKLDLMPRVQKG